jgi:hypothetical protein
MMSRRQQTFPQGSFEPPVRFYKFIAITFLVLTVVLLGVVIFMSSKRAIITITTKTSPIDVTTELVIGDTSTPPEVTATVTSTLVQLEKTFYPKGEKEQEGVATGVVTLHNESAQPQGLVATTRLLTEEGVLFRLKNAVAVPANGTLPNVAVYADVAGATGDIGPVARFTIPGLQVERQKDVYASSDTAMAGGIRRVGVLSEQDVTEATKQFQSALQSEGERLLREKMASSQGVFGVFTVTSTVVESIGDEVSAFTLRGGATVAGVFYSEAELAAWARMQLEKKAVSDVEKIHSTSNAPTVTLAAYTPGESTATIRVFYSGAVTLNADSPSIEKSVFFGKSKDDVRRMIFSLDHVSIDNVNVELQPAWMQRVPHVHDHVSVIVKEVE